jgi:transposase
MKDLKETALRAAGALNADADEVRDPLFQTGGFFDPRDMVQVKYEMLRRARVDGDPVSSVASAFGFSRPSFYEAKSAFEQGGLPALLPRKRGPHAGHKLTGEIVAYLSDLRRDQPSLSAAELAHRVAENFDLQVHPRSVERALARQEKKRQ